MNRVVILKAEEYNLQLIKKSSGLEGIISQNATILLKTNLLSALTILDAIYIFVAMKCILKIQLR